MRGISCLVSLAIFGLVARSSYGKAVHPIELAELDGKDYELPIDVEKDAEDHLLPAETEEDVADIIDDDLNKYVDDQRSKNPDAEILNEHPTHANDEQNTGGLSRIKRDRFNGIDDVSENDLSYRFRDDRHQPMIKKASGCRGNPMEMGSKGRLGVPKNFNGKYGIPRRDGIDDDDY